MPEKYKYQYDDFKVDMKKVLPSDINELIEIAVKPLDCSGLSEMFDRIRTKRMFGKVLIFDNRWMQVSEMKFQGGICSDFDLIENADDPRLVRPFHAIFRRSEKNWVVSFRSKHSTTTEVTR